MLELRALGNAEIQTEKTTLTPSQEIVFATALYLILEKGKRVSRTGLAELLWPSVELRARSHRLRQTLLQLKKLGVPLRADRDTVNLDPKDTQIDFDDGALEVGSLDRQRSLEFLPGYSPRFSESFRDWVDVQRSAAHSHSTRSLLLKMATQRERGNWSPVERLARYVLQLDPYNETAVLGLAEATAMRGQKRDAVAMLEAYSHEVGKNADLRLPAALLRKRILLAGTNVASVPVTEAAFVGREAEMEMLTKALREAHRGHGGACLIIGEPGIGKTRLATELVKFSELQGFAAQVVGCQRSNIDRPLSVLVDLVPPLREMPGALGCSQETLIALRRLTEFNAQTVDVAVSSAESHALHRALRHALFDLLDAITEEVPLILVLDDIQWIDKTSAEVISSMTTWAKTKRLLFVMNSRDETPPADLLVNADATAFRLSALTRPSAEAILEAMVRDQPPDRVHDKSQWILDVSEGNPFFLQELAKHWIECGDFSDAPSSVSNVLRNRLARLSPIACKVLQACTVLGQNSTLERVERVLEYAAHDLLGAIEELSAAGMLNCSVDSPESAFSIHTRHDLLSIAVLESITSASHAFLHRRAGLVFEHELSGDRVSTAVLWACAFHWGHAGERDRALSVVRAYADHLLELGLPEDASKALDRALDYCSSNEHRISLLARQAEVRQMAGQWEESKQVLRACRELREKITPSSDRHDRFEIMLFDASARTSVSIEEPLFDLLQCVNSEQAAAEHRVEAAVIALKLATNLDQNIAESVYGQISLLPVETGIHRTSRVEAELVYQSSCGDRDKGLAAGRTLIHLERQSRDPGRLVRALMNAGSGCRISASDAEGEEYLSEAIQCSLKHHMIERAKVSMQLMAKLHLSMCNVHLARDVLEKSKSLPVSPENRPSIIEQAVLDARLCLEEGRLELSAGVFSKVREFLVAAGGTRRSLCLALDIRFGLLAGQEPKELRPTVTELEILQRKLSRMGLQDFETESLYLGLKATGDEDRGLRLIGDYVRNQRRDLRPLPPGLTSVFAHC